MKYTLEDIRTALKNSGIDIVGCVPMSHIIKLVEDALNKQFAERQATYEEFVEKHCKECGSQRCEGIGTAWFDGCPFRGELNSIKELKMYNKIEMGKLTLEDIDTIDGLKKDLT